MKTVLVSGDAAVPPALRDLVARGSTSLEERRAAELARGDGAPALDVDRIVFWCAGPDRELADLADDYARAERKARREVVVFVAADGRGVARPAHLAPNELFTWPQDEDRLKMAFMTGA